MTYEYLCTACGHAWEAEQSISAAPLKECPSCKQESAKRQVSGGAGFILKGGGWYSDLYGTPKAKTESPAETKTSETKPADAKPAETKTDTKKDSGGSGGSTPGKTQSTPPAT